MQYETEDEARHARVLADLAATAQERARKSVRLVTQLLDDDHNDTAFVLMMVAADMLNGSAYHLYKSDKRMTETTALGLALKGLLAAIGAEKMSALLKEAAEEDE